MWLNQMYCWYLIGCFVLQLTQTAFALMNDDGDVLSIVTRASEAKEPTCEELHRMWRHSKREIQQKLDMTASPRYKGRYQEPLPYGWKSPARPRTASTSYSKPVYGRMVHSPDQFVYGNNIPNRPRYYDQVRARMGGGGSSRYYNSGPTVQKPTFFRLDYPNPVKQQPFVPMRMSHVGRFQELQSVLRNDRAKEELQATKLKLRGGNVDGDGVGSDFPNDESESRKDATYSQLRGEDTTAGKFRGLAGQDTAPESAYAENVESEMRKDSENSQSTSRPLMTDESIVHRWASGEWRRR